MAQSIAKDGQLQPIAVAANGGSTFALISGARRLAACDKLGQQVAAILVAPESEAGQLRLQLAENVQRLDFDALELGEGLAKWRGHYEAENPVAKNGGDRVSKKGKEQFAKFANRFSLEAAGLLGCSERQVYEYLELASMPAERKAEVKGSKTRRERGQAIRGAISGLRRERKVAKMEAAVSAAAPADPLVKPVVLKCMPNARWFAKAEEGSVDLILTDVPYGQSKSLIQHDARKDIKTDFGAWDKLDVGWLRHVPGVLAEGGQLLIFVPAEGIGEYKFALEALGYHYKGYIVWRKTNPGTAHRSVYLSSCEHLIWATQGKDYHFTPWENAGHAQNIIDGPICGGNERLNHPTQKPEWLIRKLLERHSHEHTRVLDPFAGVGTTAAVCAQMGRQCIAIEKDKDYVGQAVLRLKALRAAS